MSRWSFSEFASDRIAGDSESAGCSSRAWFLSNFGRLEQSGPNLNYLSDVKRGRKTTDSLGMKLVDRIVWMLRIWKDTRGQDLIEYALMAGFVAVAAGAIMPGVATSISTIFSSVASVMSGASSQS
jgi:pilus assembly protein Flp/PilA